MNIIVYKLTKEWLALFICFCKEMELIRVKFVVACIKTTLSEITLLIVFEFSDIRVVSPSYYSSLLNDFLFYFIFLFIVFWRFTSLYVQIRVSVIISFIVSVLLYFSCYLFYLYFVILFILSFDTFSRGKTW